ncbi:hypothetical protein H8E77_21025 [bacterium]|nr:hypothetical protein [bacterium]
MSITKNRQQQRAIFRLGKKDIFSLLSLTAAGCLAAWLLSLAVRLSLDMNALYTVYRLCIFVVVFLAGCLFPSHYFAMACALMVGQAVVSYLAFPPAPPIPWALSLLL